MIPYNVLELFMTNFSGEGKGGGAYLRGGGAYFELHIQQGRLIEGGHLFEEIWYMVHMLKWLRGYAIRGELDHPSP